MNQPLVGVGLKEEFCPDWANKHCSTLVTLALAQLSGVKASVPVCVVSWWGMLGDSPFHLAGGARHLESLPGCLATTATMLAEVGLDMIPGLSDVVDGVLLLVKPAVGFAILGSADKGDATWWLRAVGASLTLAVGLTKGLTKLGIDTVTGGILDPIIACLETISVCISTILVATFVVVALWVDIAIVAFVISACWRHWRRRKRAEASATRGWLLGEGQEGGGEDGENGEASLSSDAASEESMEFGEECVAATAAAVWPSPPPPPLTHLVMEQPLQLPGVSAFRMASAPLRQSHSLGALPRAAEAPGEPMLGSHQSSPRGAIERTRSAPYDVSVTSRAVQVQDHPGCQPWSMPVGFTFAAPAGLMAARGIGR